MTTSTTAAPDHRGTIPAFRSAFRFRASGLAILTRRRQMPRPKKEISMQQAARETTQAVTRPTSVGMRAVAVAALVAAVLSGCGGDNTDVKSSADATTPVTKPASELEQVRLSTAAFASIPAANAAGYTVWSPDPAAVSASCPTTPEGKMGYHLVNVPLRGTPPNAAEADTAIDYAKPEMLLYQKAGGGKLELVGVEYLVFKAAWEREHGAGAAPPQVLGQTVPASKHSFAPDGPEIEHYELHVWLHSDNPKGMFSPYNPNITC